MNDSTPKPSPAPKPTPAQQNRPVGIKQIAQACSLSAMTVSRALNNAYGVNPKTRERVLAMAREMGYIPNRLAANLVSRRSMTIGVVLPDIDHTFFPALLRGLESFLTPEGYRLFLCCSYEKAGKEYQEIMALLERRVDGIVMAPASMTESREAVQKVLLNHCPLVFVDRIVPGIETDTVIFDDFQGAYDAVTHLIEQGYERLGCLSGTEASWTSSERLRGFREAMEAAGREVSVQDVIYSGLTPEDGEAAMDRLLGRAQGYDAVFCVNDPVAFGAIKSLRRHGLQIPTRMAVAGFSDIFEADMLDPGLTTVRQNATELGQYAAQRLLSRMNPSPGAIQEEARRIVLETRLIVRQSSLRIKNPVGA